MFYISLLLQSNQFIVHWVCHTWPGIQIENRKLLVHLYRVYQLNKRILTDLEDSSESHTNSRKWYYQTIHNELSIYWDFTLAVLFDEEFHYTHIGGDFESIFSKRPIHCGLGKMQTQRNITEFSSIPISFSFSILNSGCNSSGT